MVQTKEEIAAKQKAYRQRPEVKEKIRLRKQAYHKEYYQRPEVRDHRKKYMKEYCQRPRYKDYDKKRRQTLLRKNWKIEYEGEKYEKNKKYLIAKRLRGRVRRAFNFYTKEGKIFSSKTYGINYKAIIEHLKPFPRDVHLYHIDHIIPLAKFDLEKPEEIKKALAPENHQWMLISDNCSKGKKVEIQTCLI